MKQEKKEKKFQLNRLTVANLETLEVFEQSVINGGSISGGAGSTVVPIYCEP